MPLNFVPYSSPSLSSASEQSAVYVYYIRLLGCNPPEVTADNRLRVRVPVAGLRPMPHNTLSKVHITLTGIDASWPLYTQNMEETNSYMYVCCCRRIKHGRLDLAGSTIYPSFAVTFQE